MLNFKIARNNLIYLYKNKINQSFLFIFSTTTGATQWYNKIRPPLIEQGVETGLQYCSRGAAAFQLPSSYLVYCSLVLTPNDSSVTNLSYHLDMEATLTVSATIFNILTL